MKDGKGLFSHSASSVWGFALLSTYFSLMKTKHHYRGLLEKGTKRDSFLSLSVSSRGGFRHVLALKNGINELANKLSWMVFTTFLNYCAVPVLRVCIDSMSACEASANAPRTLWLLGVCQLATTV